MADQNPIQAGTIDLRAGATGTPGGPGSASGTATPGPTGASSTGTQSNQTAGRSSAPGSDLFSKFDIPEVVRQQFSDLIPLILTTESMNDEERQYWFQILPIMTDEQVNKLRDILKNEKQQLDQLDKEYQQDVKRINDKHVSEWKEFEAKEKRRKLKQAESAASEAEKKHEEELLQKLQNI